MGTPGLDSTPADYVATVTAPFATFASLTVGRPVRTALDIGSGSGVQALGAAMVTWPSSPTRPRFWTTCYPSPTA